MSGEGRAMMERYLPGGGLEGRPVLVTGATGFIGGRLAERLSGGERAQVTATGRRVGAVSGSAAGAARQVQADLLDRDRMRELVRGQEVVFHVAGWVGGDPDLAHAVNVEATGELVRAAAGAGVRRFVHVSSVSVYGDPGGTVDEDAPLVVHSPIPYARTKALGELRAREEADRAGLELVVVRPASVFGPRSSLWTTALTDYVCSGVPVLVGKGSGRFSPIYVDDLVDAMLLCAASGAAPGEAFNVSDDPVPWRTFVAAHARLCGTELRTLPPEEARAVLAGERPARGRLPTAEVAYLVILSVGEADTAFSSRKLRRLLDWEPRVGVEGGLERAAAWLRAEGRV